MQMPVTEEQLMAEVVPPIEIRQPVMLDHVVIEPRPGIRREQGHDRVPGVDGKTEFPQTEQVTIMIGFKSKDKMGFDADASVLDIFCQQKILVS